MQLCKVLAFVCIGAHPHIHERDEVTGQYIQPYRYSTSRFLGLVLVNVVVMVLDTMAVTITESEVGR